MSFREVIDSGDKEAIDEAAKSMGVTPEQLDTIADQIEVIVFGPTVKGFAVNINAVPQPNTAMPSAAEATSQLQGIGGRSARPRRAPPHWASRSSCPTRSRCRTTPFRAGPC